MTDVSVLIVGTTPIIRGGIRRALEQADGLKVVGEAADMSQSVAMAANCDPDVVVIDATSHDYKAAELASRIREAQPEVSLVAIVPTEQGKEVIDLIQCGVTAMLLSNASNTAIVHAVLSSQAGEMVMDPRIGRELAGTIRKGTPVRPGSPHDLKQRERDMLKLIAKGLTNRQIANELGYRERTVKGYVSSLFSKLEAASRIEAVLTAVKLGYLSPIEVLGDAAIPVPSELQRHVAASRLAETPDIHPDLSSTVGFEQAIPHSAMAAVSWKRCKIMVERVGGGCVLCQDWKYLFANEAMAELLGYPQSELIGMPFMEVIPPEIRPQFAHMHRERLAGKPVPEQFDLALLRKDRTRVLLSLSVRLCSFDDVPAVAGIITLATNPQKMREARFRQWLGSLSGADARRASQDIRP